MVNSCSRGFVGLLMRSFFLGDAAGAATCLMGDNWRGGVLPESFLSHRIPRNPGDGVSLRSCLSGVHDNGSLDFRRSLFSGDGLI